MKKSKDTKRGLRLVGVLVLIIVVGFMVFNLVPGVKEKVKRGAKNGIEKVRNIKKSEKNKDYNLSGQYIWLGTDLLDTKGGTVKPVTDQVVKDGYVARFENGKFSSTTLCNSLMGSYEKKGSEIKFGPMASTKMACADDVMKQEQEYSMWIGKVSKFEKKGDFLFLTDEENTFKMNFKVYEEDQTNTANENSQEVTEGVNQSNYTGEKKRDSMSTEDRYKKNNINVDVENEVIEIGVDLNGDTLPEFISFVENKNYCGTGGCTLFVFKLDGTIITEMTVSEKPVYLSNEKTNGWNDFVVYSDGSLRKISFDGKTYNTNPSLAPKLTQKEVDENTGSSIDKKYFLIMAQ